MKKTLIIIMTFLMSIIFILIVISSGKPYKDTFTLHKQTLEVLNNRYNITSVEQEMNNIKYNVNLDKSGIITRIDDKETKTSYSILHDEVEDEIIEEELELYNSRKIK